MSEKESLAYPDAKKEVAEKVEEEKESNTMKKEVEVVASDSVSNQNQNNNNENQHQNPLTEPSSSTITLHSSSPPSSSLRTRKSPSPPLHSISDSSISSGHSSTGHVSSSPSPPRKSPAVSSPESSISDGHFSLRDEATPIEDQRFPPVPAPVPVVVAHRFQVEPNVVTRVDPGAEEGFIGVNDVKQASAGDGGGNGGGGGGTNRRLRPDVMSMLRSKKIAMWNKVLLSLRIATFASCLMSLSVLAADKRKGWAQDSFYRYKEFRYSLSVNAIGFMYSVLQICDLVKYIFTRKHIVEHQLRALFSFVMDQILTYLLMSASSSAATRAYDWESNWGKDKFPDMANASVVLSFVAFVAFAFTSLVSGSILCRFR
ncbi:CASP-like protein 4A3 [Arachis stenosperma]|uniref:CASP-like protein 4A3 n=1 Tax=Arachis stenosperma TaxID=217475 RepID=UPI0025AD4239|nr:CASP-like protein 4A3 [Arachis stenosperma]